jgi:hypothetical protein
LQRVNSIAETRRARNVLRRSVKFAWDARRRAVPQSLAIGITDEHILHYYTRRLWQWRAEAGSENFWAEWLGRKAFAAGGNALWNNIVTSADEQLGQMKERSVVHQVDRDDIGRGLSRE